MKTTDQAVIARILKNSKTVAVVGLSKDPGKESHRAAAYLQSKGYKVIPVNPTADMILGEKAYTSLLDIPGKIDVVDVFRPSEEVLPIVDQAIKKRAKTVWMQLGIVNEEAADKAAKAGMDVVMDRCMRTEHKRLVEAWL